jgi:hypothetical protein
MQNWGLGGDLLVLGKFGAGEIDHAQRLYIIDIDRAVNNDLHTFLSFYS